MKKIDDQMTRAPWTVTTKTSATEAMALMKTLEIRHLPVLESGKVVGLVSDRDFKTCEHLVDVMTVVVGDVMTPDPYCVHRDTPLAQVVRNMAAQKFGSVVVLDGDDRVIGIFTTTDALTLLARLADQPQAGSFWAQSIESFLSRSATLYS